MKEIEQAKNQAERVVIKVGGSLLAKPGLPAALQNWLQNDPLVKDKSQRVFIAGGGERVDTLRAIDAANPLPPDVTHWAAIDVMDQNARWLASWMKEATLTTSYRRLRRGTQGDWILEPGQFLRQEEPTLPGVRLPVGWEVTSDSIAARVAALLGASLVLLKPAAPSPSFLAKDWQKASDRGYTDLFFPEVASGPTVVSAVFLSI